MFVGVGECLSGGERLPGRVGVGGSLSGSFGHLQLILSTCSFIQCVDVKEIEQVLFIDMPFDVEVEVWSRKGP